MDPNDWNARNDGPDDEAAADSVPGAELDADDFDDDDPTDEIVEEDESETAELAETKRQLAEQRDRFLRLAAEFDNYRKRSSKERLEASSRGQGDLVRQMLDALDDLSRFAHLDPASADPTTIVTGVELVEKKLLKILGAAGLQPVDPLGEAFDPTLHEAVSTEPADSPDDADVVSRVYQVGYTFNGQLLRPARVVVKQWTG
jgi:molecular chaperone GrpE